VKIENRFSKLNGEDTRQEIEEGISIIAEDGNTLFDITLKDGELEVRSGMFCKHGGELLEDALLIKPYCSNVVKISRVKYDQ